MIKDFCPKLLYGRLKREGSSESICDFTMKGKKPERNDV